MKRKTLWLDRTLVYNPYYFALCLNKKEFKRACKDIGLPKKDVPEFTKSDDNARIHYFVKDNGNNAAIICLKPKKRSIQEIHGLLVHEAVHLWQQIKEHIEESLPSAEFEAYAIQNLAQNLFEAYKERK